MTFFKTLYWNYKTSVENSKYFCSACGKTWTTDAVVKHGLRTPNEAFFHWNPELLGLGRQIGQINSGAFGVISAKLSAPILVQWVPLFPT